MGTRNINLAKLTELGVELGLDFQGLWRDF